MIPYMKYSQQANPQSQKARVAAMSFAEEGMQNGMENGYSKGHGGSFWGETALEWDSGVYNSVNYTQNTDL